MRTLHKVMWVAVLAMVAVTALQLSAQTPVAPKTASQFYLEYRAAFDKAQKVEDLFPFVAAAQRKQMEDTPVADRVKMFGLMKMMGSLTNLQILKEERNGTGATLTVDAIDGDRQKQKGTVEVIREGGAWKVGQERWSN